MQNCIYTGNTKILAFLIEITAPTKVKTCFTHEQMETDMRKLLGAILFLFSVSLYNCSSSEKSYVYSNVTGEAFSTDNEKNYKGYNPHNSNDTLYRRYERSDSLTASEIYDNKKESEISN